MTAEQLEQEVLKLPAEQRARLAERIIASLGDRAEIRQESLQDAQPRGHDLVTATEAAIPTEDDLASIRRLASLYIRPEAALDEFIEAWRTSRSDDRAASQ